MPESSVETSSLSSEPDSSYVTGNHTNAQVKISQTFIIFLYAEQWDNMHKIDCDYPRAKPELCGQF